MENLCNKSINNDNKKELCRHDGDFILMINHVAKMYYIETFKSHKFKK